MRAKRVAGTYADGVTTSATILIVDDDENLLKALSLLLRRAGFSPLTATCSAWMRRDDTGRWSVGVEGTTFALADLRGLRYLRYLLERPGVEVEALELSDAAIGHPGAALDQADLGDLLDATALAAYRRRLSELDAELDAVDARGNQSVATTLSAERDALLGQLRSVAGVGGRTRRGGASAERARIAVRKAIAAALTQIDKHDAAVAGILRDTVRTGMSCRYDPHPDQPVTWVTRH